VVPPTAPPGTQDEFVDGLPIGFGPRVPMTVISPWSKGGYVNSQVFDHTSVLRFLELWTGVREPNISAWRRSTAGDLTSCFDFSRPEVSFPKLPDANKLQAIADQTQSRLPTPTPPATGKQAVPRQDAGVRPARALPYQPTANVSVAQATGHATVLLANSGSAALQFGVYPTGATPQRVDVTAGGKANADVPAAADGSYGLAVHSVNGFLREFAGHAGGSAVEVSVTVVGGGSHPKLRITLHNGGHATATVRVTGTRPGAGHTTTYRVPGGATLSSDRDVLGDGKGWYDVRATVEGDSAFRRHFAGHVENGEESISG
jgi:phospholipase C